MSESDPSTTPEQDSSEERERFEGMHNTEAWAHRSSGGCLVVLAALTTAAVLAHSTLR